MIEAKIDWSDLEKDLDRIADYAKSGRPEKVAARVTKASIYDRSSRGLDSDNKRYKPYTSSYAKQRKKEGLRVSPPDLIHKDVMLKSLHLKEDGTMSVSNEERAKAEGNVKHGRQPFGVNATDAKVIAKDIAKDLSDY